MKITLNCELIIAAEKFFFSQSLCGLEPRENLSEYVKMGLEDL